jgi:membrane protease YdiL (CAAX protease family)
MSDYQALHVTEMDRQQEVDPDRPAWGILTGIGIWIFSYMSQLLAFGVWFGIQLQVGGASLMSREELDEWFKSPQVIFASIISTAVAHILTLILCWAVVTRFGKQPFLPSLGWHWAGFSRSGKLLLVFGVVAGIYIINIGLVQVLPESETTRFSEMLKSSNSVRVAVALMAVLTAPIVEEMVYRGILYSPLKSRLGMSASVLIVTILFVLVHFHQYEGAWASLVGLSILSFVLTLIRAVTRSILPCVAIHLVFNFVGAIFIVRPVFQ